MRSTATRVTLKQGGALATTADVSPMNDNENVSYDLNIERSDIYHKIPCLIE